MRARFPALEVLDLDALQRAVDAAYRNEVPAGVVHRTRAVGRTVNLTVERQGAEAEFVDAPPGRPLA